MTRAAFVFLLVLCACAPTADVPCAPRCTGVRIDPAFGAEERLAIHEAMLVWARATGGWACFIEADRAELVVVRVGTDGDLARYYPRSREWSGKAGIYTSGTIALVAGGASYRSLLAVTVHELGHAAGLGHAEGGVMRAAHGELAANGDLPREDAERYCAARRCGCSP